MKFVICFWRLILPITALIALSGCWQVTAARAAKKRTQETGYIMGTIEKETGIEDPLNRKQRSINSDGL